MTELEKSIAELRVLIGKKGGLATRLSEVKTKIEVAKQGQIAAETALRQAQKDKADADSLEAIAKANRQIESSNSTYEDTCALVANLELKLNSLPVEIRTIDPDIKAARQAVWGHKSAELLAAAMSCPEFQVVKEKVLAAYVADSRSGGAWCFAEFTARKELFGFDGMSDVPAPVFEAVYESLSAEMEGDFGLVEGGMN